MAMNPAELAAQAAQRKTATENPEAVSYDPADLDIAMGDIMRQIDDAMTNSAVSTESELGPESGNPTDTSADGTAGTHAEVAADAADNVVAAFERAHHTLHETLENAHVPTQVSAQPVEGSF